MGSAMFGTIEVKLRPIRFAYLVDPNDGTQVRQSIQAVSSLWAGSFSPIVPIFGRTPQTWREGHLAAPSAKEIVLGYIDAFDLDVLVQVAAAVPSYVKDLGLELIALPDIWGSLDRFRFPTPNVGIGLFEILGSIFEENFRYKAKYPIEVVLPAIPNRLGLFWATVFGEIVAPLREIVDRDFTEPLEIKQIDDVLASYKTLFERNVVFPRRITQHELRSSNRAGFRQRAFAFFLDATNVQDIIDYWNLRAVGRQVVPVPKQLLKNPQLKDVVIGFLKANRVPWRNDPAHCDSANFVRARSCSMKDMEAFAKTINIAREPGDPSNDPFFGLQHWYPRIWDEWARDKDGVVPDDVFGVEEESIDLDSDENQQIRIPSVVPKFAAKYRFLGEHRCANEIGFRIYGQKDYLAEVFPKWNGKHYIRAISGADFRDWRVGRIEQPDGC